MSVGRAKDGQVHVYLLLRDCIASLVDLFQHGGLDHGNPLIPGSWEKFLADVDNKKKLFSFLSKRISEENYPDEKDVYITADD